MQPTSFSVSDTSGSTVIPITDNNQTYTLNGVRLNQLQMGSITALDSNTTAKWQTLISNASRPTTRASDGVRGQRRQAEGQQRNLEPPSGEPVEGIDHAGDGAVRPPTARRRPPHHVAASGTVTFAAGET